MTQAVLAPETELEPETVERTFVFCDVAGFTEMTERLGDRGAHDVIRRYRLIVREAVQELCGEELELRGDGFLLAFDSPSAALECAVVVRRRLAIGDARRAAPVSVRIGLHTGYVLHDGDGYFGRDLIVAARIAERAAVDEILISDCCWREAAEGVSEEPPVWRDLRLKGIQRTQRVLVAAGPVYPPARDDSVESLRTHA